jgi:hypothetical protein
MFLLYVPFINLLFHFLAFLPFAPFLKNGYSFYEFHVQPLDSAYLQTDHDVKYPFGHKSKPQHASM